MTEIASHRGGALLWAENSRLAFEQTAKLPVEQVEFDVHPSRDGRLVVIHDATLERTTDGAGAVCQHDWAELCKLILKGSGGQRMLLLDEVVEIFRPTGIILRLEMKAGPGRVPYPDHPARITAALKAASTTSVDSSATFPPLWSVRASTRIFPPTCRTASWPGDA